MDTLENVLCLQGQQRNYLVKLSDMVEICTHVSISKIPCLPPYYLGIFHYKGNILPVLQLDENVFSLTDTTILVVKNEDCYFGIQIGQEPVLENIQNMTFTTNKQEFLSDIGYIQSLYQYENKIYYFIDIEKTIQFLISEENI